MGYIRASGIIVDFPVYGAGSRSLKKTFMRAATGGTVAQDSADHLVVRALNNVCFEIREGDRVGLMGHNGSGKSTLLRVIAGAYEPVAGDVEVRGTVTSMLSVFLGMDNEATGLENLYLRGAFMGLRRHEVDFLVPDISEFSELGDYLHMPLRTYSSGMAMRLAFAMSTSVSADIVLMDEWLNVGDAAFSERAQNRLQRILDKAKILVLASHDEQLIRKNCNRVMRLDHGELAGLEELPGQSPGRLPNVA